MRLISQYIAIFFIMLTLTGCFFNNSDVQRWEVATQGTTSFALSRDARFGLFFVKEGSNAANTDSETQNGLHFWDLVDNKELTYFGAQDQRDSTVSHITISDNSRFAITATQTNFAVWDLGMGVSEGLWSISDGIIRDVDIASNGQQVLLGLSNGKAIYIDLATGRRLEFLAHREKVNSVALSANGKFALSGGNDHFAYFWDTQTGQILRTFEHEKRVSRIALQRDGKYALTADGGNEAFIWDLKTGDKITKLSTFSRQQVFSSARFSDNGQYLVTGSPAGTVMLWDTLSGKKQEQWRAEPLKDARPPTAVVYDVAIDKKTTSRFRYLSRNSSSLVDRIMTTDIKKLEDKISNLECQMAFQEQTVEELNDALSQQQLLITNMQVQMKFMVGKMKTMDTSSMADASEETPPPHY